MINKKFHQTIGKMLETPIQTMLYFGIITLCAVCFLGVLGFAVAGFVFCKIVERGGFEGMKGKENNYHDGLNENHEINSSRDDDAYQQSQHSSLSTRSRLDPDDNRWRFDN